MNDVRVLGRPS